jgi:predicted dehydrogenase
VLGASSRIARRAIIPALNNSDRHEVVALASRADGDGGWGPYDALLARPDVDIVYNPLPNGLHQEWTSRALAAGKHVLCEKPLAPDVASAIAMFKAADAAGRVVIEAYMTPFHPRTELLEGLVQSGRLGELLAVQACFTFPIASRDDHRLTALGDGALLDVGIYCVAPMLRWAARSPERVAATALRNAGGVDVSLTGWLDFGDGFGGSFTVSFDGPQRQWQQVVGTEGIVAIEQAYVPGRSETTLDVVRRDGRVEQLRCEPGNPYEGLVDHVHAVVCDGVAPRHGRADTLAVAATLDRLRAASLAAARG